VTDAEVGFIHQFFLICSRPDVVDVICLLLFGELGTVTVILNVIQLYSSYEIASRITLTLCTHVRYVVKSSVFFKFACVWHIRVCKLTTLHYRQIRGDMIEVYKIVSGKYDCNNTNPDYIRYT